MQLLEYQLASRGQGSVEWRAHIAEVAKQNPGISGKMVGLMSTAPCLSCRRAAAGTAQSTRQHICMQGHVKHFNVSADQPHL